MKRMLFTIPNDIAQSMEEFVPVGERSKFVVKYITIPLKKLQKTKKKVPIKASSIYKPQFLRDIAKAEKDIKEGRIYSQEEVMKELGIL